MVMIRHPLSGAEYRRNEDGTVLVTGKDGVEGTFNRRGDWISGRRRSADAALCQWVADGYLPTFPNRDAASPPDATPAEENAV